MSLFCAATISDRTYNEVSVNFNVWKSRQPHFTFGGELKGKDLSTLQQASFVNSVIMNSTEVRLTLAGTKTTLFEKRIAEQYQRRCEYSSGYRKKQAACWRLFQKDGEMDRRTQPGKFDVDYLP